MVTSSHHEPAPCSTPAAKLLPSLTCSLLPYSTSPSNLCLNCHVQDRHRPACLINAQSTFRNLRSRSAFRVRGIVHIRRYGCNRAHVLRRQIAWSKFNCDFTRSVGERQLAASRANLDLPAHLTFRCADTHRPASGAHPEPGSETHTGRGAAVSDLPRGGA